MARTDWANGEEFTPAALNSLSSEVNSATNAASAANSALNGKADVGHDHNDLYYTEAEVDALIAGVEGGSGPHTHNDIYYTEQEVDNALANKADLSHDHDSRYYTESQINSMMAGKQNAGDYIEEGDPRLSDARTPTAHDHDNRYYTESEVDNLIAQVDGGGGTGPHDHNDLYYTEVEINSMLSNYVEDDDPRLSDERTPIAHDHDDRYYTEVEIDSTLDNYVEDTDPRLSDARPPEEHDHNDMYYTESEIDTMFANVDTGGGGINAITGTASDLASSNPVPDAGQTVYATDTNEMALGDGTSAWADLPKFEPRGDRLLAYAESAVVQTGIGNTITDLTGLEVSFEVVDRPVMVELVLPWITGSNAGSSAFLYITDMSDNTVAMSVSPGMSTALAVPGGVKHRISAPGSYTLKARMNKLGTGTVGNNADAAGIFSHMSAVEL